MEVQVAQFTNKGMFQDTSVSKAINEFAFKNYNIRITAVNDNTLFSVTNEKLPAKSNTTSSMVGKFLTSCIVGEYVVVFTKHEGRDYIYRLNLEGGTFNVVLLYSGNLNIGEKIETLPYYEAEDVQKVYWVDGINQTRFINIKSNNIHPNNDNQFDFNPPTTKTPSVSINKTYNSYGSFPSGVIQYFISYYNKFGAESAIVYNSPLYYINLENRAASPSEDVKCVFNIHIENLDTLYDNIRVYSIKRGTYNGSIEAKLVADLNIKDSTSIDVIDTNVNQEAIDPNMLLFLGGNEIIASTITQKDNTLFLGNVELKDNIPDVDVLESLRVYNSNTGRYDAKGISFNTKSVDIKSEDDYYTISQQTSKNNSLEVKSFKRGEIYRFAIQLQTTSGVWTSPVWIGDKECDLSPVIDPENNQVLLPNATFTMPSNVREALKSKYVNYRLLVAETSLDTRSIVAQGVVNPTLFNYEERCTDGPYSISSWIMRPRGGNANYKHLDNVGVMQNKLSDGTVESGDIVVEVQGLLNREAPVNTTPATGSDYRYVMSIGLMRGKKIQIYYGIENLDGSNKVKIFKENINETSWRKAYNAMINLCLKYNVIITDLSEDTFMNFVNHGEVTEKDGITYVADTDLKWEVNSFGNVDFHKTLFQNTINFGGDGYVMSRVVGIGKGNAVDIIKKKNNYYIDSSVVTFHSPELNSNSEYINNSNLRFRIVGLVPITGNYSDISLQASTGYNKDAGIDKSKIKNTININTGVKDLISEYMYSDAALNEEEGQLHVANDKIVNYEVYLWNSQGSITGGDSNNIIKDEDDNKSPSILESKCIANQRYSAFTKYLNKEEFWDTEISLPQLFDSETLALKKLNIGQSKDYYSGNYDKMLTFNADSAYPVRTDGGTFDVKNTNPVRIKYKSTPHVVFGMLHSEDTYNVLPHLFHNDEMGEGLVGLYDVVDSIYPWSTTDADYKYVCIYATSMLNIDNPSIIIGEWGEQAKTYLKNGYIPYIAWTEGDVFLGVPEVIRTVIEFKDNNGELVIESIPVGSMPDEFYDTTHKVDLTSDTEYFKLLSGSMFNVDNLGTITFVNTIHYNQDTILDVTSDYPYLFLGELYREIPYNSLYGGTDPENIKQIRWIPASLNTSINSNIYITEGDTYVQRWDCLKTYPYTEEDINKVVDITSFMLETYTNIEGRYDINRGIGNILNARPTNFGLYNTVYDQTNNLFTYNVLDEKFYNKKYEHQILFSLEKTPNSNIDDWAGITNISALNLNGSYGKITKLVVLNNNIIALQDKAVSIINFNNKTMLSTEGGVPIEITNSGKVNGYSIVSSRMGCQNNKAVCMGNAGLYFIDNYNKALYSINGEGVSNISGTKGFTMWFKDKLSSNDTLYYDNQTHEVYINNGIECINYNEDLQSFVSFYDYASMKSLFNLNGESYIIKDDLSVNQMFAGEYSNDYYIHYRVNPDPLVDKIFTNVEFIADCFDPSIQSSLDYITTHSKDIPFNSIKVWNEYQEGETNITDRYKYPNFEKKFRIWRSDIPRDKSNGRDRIRNPWMHLKISKTGTTLNDKMVFHNLLVKYYK